MCEVTVSPPSTFSSLLTSITTNFSQTANVGKVEEMNWPNLKLKHKVLKKGQKSFIHALKHINGPYKP